MTKNINEITKRIAKLNDDFREAAMISGSDCSLGQVVYTSGIMALASEDVESIVTKVRLFDDFNEGNDPYGEHDFGSFTHKANKVYWKIDYKDPHLEYQNRDMNRCGKTNRILTIMLSHEY